MSAANSSQSPERIEEIRKRFERGIKNGWPYAIGPREIQEVFSEIDRLHSALASAEEEAGRVRTVHLQRHERLSDAVGMDPGYSADATIDEAITRLSEIERLRADAERLDWLQRYLHDAEAGTIGDVTLYGSFRGVSFENEPTALTLRAAIDTARTPTGE